MPVELPHGEPLEVTRPLTVERQPSASADSFRFEETVRLVLVAFVVVAFNPVKFWRVDEPLT